MAQSQPRFALVDDDSLQDIIESADSDNTKKQVKYATKIFEDYLTATQMDLTTVHQLPNLTLDNILAKFYASSRQQNGTKYSKKSMSAIRFGLQRHFLNSANKVDIIKHADFNNSSRVFKSFAATLKKEGKAEIHHKQPIPGDDMARIQDSFDLATPLGLQDKVFFDVMLYFCNRGRENLREMTLERFEEHEEGEKLNPACKSFWQRPKIIAPDNDSEPWYNNSPLGKNTLGDKVKNVSLRANCSRTYTNHCLQATSITTLDTAGFTSRDIMTVSGHHSEASIKNYARTSEAKKVEMSNAIAAVIDPRPQSPVIPQQVHLTLQAS
ncbi:uncharacterized protein [Amphiura filiformis]|uniref:uncharacterized protein n=1 Tax=Amphiura filiformis TaxID=82378 RepID=UPI003B226638